jgi:predicted hydrocarbon binding protein
MVGKTMAYVEDLLKTLKETSNFLTACFLNGLFSAVKNQHVREINCIAAGDPYCKWEIA